MTEDTSPMVKSKRIKRQVRIQEVNKPPSSVFDTIVEYPSDGLPEWFASLQPIVEDETFTSMAINLGGKVYYRITLADEEEPPDLVKEMYERIESPDYSVTDTYQDGEPLQ